MIGVLLLDRVLIISHRAVELIGRCAGTSMVWVGERGVRQHMEDPSTLTKF